MTEKKSSGATAGKRKASPASAEKSPPAGAGTEVKVDENKAAAVSTVKTADLKNRFAAGSIPLSTDFGDLIDIAEYGRRAVGQSADQTDNTVGVGLSLASDSPNVGKLSVHAKADAGIDVSSSGVGVKIVASDGLTVGSSGMQIRKGAAITIDSSGIAVQCSSGAVVANNYVSVKTGPGIAIDGNSAVSVKGGNGIKVDASAGVSVDLSVVFPKGMVMMFAGARGAAIPSGWALCDGSNSTPDLRDRFILGGDMTNVGAKNNLTVSGDISSKAFVVTTDNGNLQAGVTVNSHQLSIDEMPSHRHSIYVDGPYGDKFNLYFYQDGYAAKQSQPRAVVSDDKGEGQYTMTSEGGDRGHSHTASLTNESHSHKATITTPYYILAFIIKT